MLQVWKKGCLPRECPHTGNLAITQSWQTPIINNQQTCCAETTLFLATKPTLSQTITVKTPFTAEEWQTLWNI